MTTEDDFQTALDAQPDDWQTHLVFADWLQERDDPRAEGYRALAARAWRAMPCQMQEGPLLFIIGTETISAKVHKVTWRDCLLPPDWFKAVKLSRACANRHDKWKYYPTRREAEDAAARAFAKLAAARRAELLASRRVPR